MTLEEQNIKLTDKQIEKLISPFGVKIDTKELGLINYSKMPVTQLCCQLLSTGSAKTLMKFMQGGFQLL